MSDARFYAPDNRLGAAIAQPGGKPLAAALADAERQLEAAAGPAATRIDEILAAINALCADGEPPPEPLYRLAREAAGLGAVAHLPDLGQAALALCNLIDLSRRSGRLSADQIQVSLGAMRLLRQPERFDAGARKILLDDLKGVLDKAQKPPAA